MISKREAQEMRAQVERPAKRGGFSLFRTEAVATLDSLEEAMECFGGLLEHHDVQCNFRDAEGCECWACVARALLAKWEGRADG